MFRLAYNKPQVLQTIASLFQNRSFQRHDKFCLDKYWHTFEKKSKCIFYKTFFAKLRIAVGKPRSQKTLLKIILALYIILATCFFFKIQYFNYRVNYVKILTIFIKLMGLLHPDLTYDSNVFWPWCTWFLEVRRQNEKAWKLGVWS